MKDASSAAKKWHDNLSNATQAYTSGIQNTQVDPTALAAANAAGMLAGVQKAVNGGKWQRGLQRAGKAGWQNGAIQYGAANLANGAAKGQSKMQSFLQDFLPQAANWQAQVKAMPNVTPADKKARMNKWFDLASQYQRK